MTGRDVWDPAQFWYRVDYAACQIARRGRVTARLNACFGMGDGEAVQVALVRRARLKPRGPLAATLYTYINREIAEAAHQRAAGIRTMGLAAEAARQREEPET
jgi:hypothetical protein